MEPAVIAVMVAFPRRSARIVSLTLCSLLPALILLQAAVADQPLSVKEICLMLRGGYTGAEILRDTAGRPLLEPLDANAEKALRQAGADAAFIASFKVSHRTLSEQESALARDRQSDLERKDLESRQASQTRLQEIQRQTATALSRVGGQSGASSHMADLLRGKLVTLRGGKMQPYDDGALSRKKVFALYFSASWCGPCRKFTPQFVEFYNKFAPAHPEFEAVFISQDRSAADMVNYMRQDGMNWAALTFERKEQEKELTHYAGSGIPDLVLVDGSGRVLSDSFQGENYVGPYKVLTDLNRLLASGR